jgi:transcriptional regulator with XRE-family HTH domain
MLNIGRDVRTARLALRWTQAEVARRAGTSQSSVSRLEAGDMRLALRVVATMVRAVGLVLGVRTFPGDGVGLRDSGQLALAEKLRAFAHRTLRVQLEVPTGQGRQAADMLLTTRTWGIHLELESLLTDFQGQLRAGHLKRDAVQQRLGMPIAFVLAIRDTDRNRRAVAAQLDLIRQALPAGSRDVLTAVRTGRPLHQDGLLWLR